MPQESTPTTEAELESADEQRRLRVLTILCIALAAMAPAFIYQYVDLGVPSVSVALCVVVFFAFLNIIWARRRGGSRAGGWIATTLLFSLLLYSNWISGGFYDPNFGWLYLFPMLAALLVDARAGWVFTGLVLLATVGFWIAPQIGIEISSSIPPDRHAEQSLANRVSAVVALGILLSAIASQQRFSKGLLELANQRLRQELDKRSQMQERLLRTERAASIGSLASGMAHEINNPLTYVIGNLQLLQDHLGSQTTLPREASNPSTQDLLAEALEGSERVANLVRDLKTFSHSNDEVTRSVSLNEAIERSVRLVTNEIRHRSVLKVECEHELHVEGNAGRIQQVLVNLLVNAAHAIEPGSSEENLIRISVNSQSERVLIEISDTGTGIDPAIVDQIFEPLFTTKEVGFGMGMGLSITRNIVQSMGGAIEVDSTLGVGSTFSVWLNLADSNSERISESSDAQDPAPAPVRELDILIVDDEPDVLRYLTAALSKHRVTTVHRAKLSVSRILNDTYDVILCDLMMPEMTGMELHAAIEEKRPDIARRMFFMTAGVLVEQAQTFLAELPDRWIEKPFSIKELEQRLGGLAKTVDDNRQSTPTSV